MNDIEILDKLRKMLFTTQQANECGLSNNDFKEDIQILSGTIGLIENLIEENKELRIEISARETVVDELEKENKELKEENQQQRHQLNSAFSNGFIHKNKVKEKIEVIQKRMKEETRTDFLITLKILENELQELLEEGE